LIQLSSIDQIEADPFLSSNSHPRIENLWVLLNELNTLSDVLLQVSQAGIDELLLLWVNLANWVNLLNTLWAELDLGGEELNTLVLVEWGLDEGWLNDTSLALSSLEEGLSEAGTSHSHGEGGGTGTVLGLDNLVATELDALEEVWLANEVWVVGLGEKWDNGDTRVTSNDGDVLISWVGLLDLRDEAGGADDVKGGDTEEALWVVDTGLLEDLGDNWDGGVNWVRDNEDLGVWGRLGGGLCEVADNGGVGVEEIITGHAWLSWDTGWDENDLSALEGSIETGWGWVVTGDGALGVDVGDISGDTCCVC
jgi:hypothetical protein